MKGKDYDRKQIAYQHSIPSYTSKDIVFNGKLSKIHYYDGIEVGKCDAMDNILPSEEELKDFLGNYYGNISNKEINDFIVGFLHAKRKIICNPNDPIIVDNNDSTILAYRNFFSKKRKK